ncbi:MAG: SDR family NAD(P)-dependent oxidoreductase [Alphaproteobacteria bacterium]
MELILKGKVALITGASRGIGAAVAKRFAKEGAHVLIVGKTISGLEEVDDYARKHGSSATLIPFDITDFLKIDELAKIIAQKFGKLDILVGNAAILGVLSPVSHTSPEIWEKVIDTNLNANWRLIRGMDLLLNASGAGKVIFVTSEIAKNSSPYWGAYATSKAALETMVKIYAKEVDPKRIKVNLIDPGVIATRMRKEAMPGEDMSLLKQPEEITDIFVSLASDDCDINGEILKAY